MNYDQHPGLRWSVLREALTSPLHLRHRLDTPRDDSASMAFGRAVHLAVLEPDRFDREAISVPPEYVTATGSMSTAKAAREWQALQAPDALLLTDRDRDACLRIRDAIDAHEDARVWLAASTLREHEVYWTETTEHGAVACKAKPDAIAPRLGLLWDLKTTASKGGPISLDGCCRTIASYLYHAQLGHYARGLAAQPDPVTVEAIGWVFVESAAPFDVVVLQADDQMLAEGWRLSAAALRRYAEATETGRWHGVAPRMAIASLPKWAAIGGE